MIKPRSVLVRKETVKPEAEGFAIGGWFCRKEGSLLNTRKLVPIGISTTFPSSPMISKHFVLRSQNLIEGIFHYIRRYCMGQKTLSTLIIIGEQAHSTTFSTTNSFSYFHLPRIPNAASTSSMQSPKSNHSLALGLGTRMASNFRCRPISAPRMS